MTDAKKERGLSLLSFMIWLNYFVRFGVLRRPAFPLLNFMIWLNYSLMALCIFSLFAKFQKGLFIGAFIFGKIASSLSAGSETALIANIMLFGSISFFFIMLTFMFNDLIPSMVCFFIAAMICFFTYSQIRSATLREELAKRVLYHQQKAAEEKDAFAAMEKDELDRKAAEEKLDLERKAAELNKK